MKNKSFYLAAISAILLLTAFTLSPTQKPKEAPGGMAYAVTWKERGYWFAVGPHLLSGPTGSFEQITIGKQVWMVTNLNVDKFRNGEIIPHAKTSEEWLKAGKEGKPAWCYYDNNPSNEQKYGKLYNWFAVNDIRGLAPTGWHVPNEEDWNTINTFLGGVDIAGSKMKSKTGWSENGNGNNESKFNALPGGCRDNNGNFSGLALWSYWWSSKQASSEGGRFRHLTFGHNNLGHGDRHKGEGYYVRCIKD